MIRPHHRAVAEAFDAAKSFSIFAGSPEAGFNAGWELCGRWAEADRDALRWMAADGAVHTLTYAELTARAARFADFLQAEGVRPGDRVAGLLPRTPDLLTVFIGTLWAGAVYQPLFTAFGSKAIESRVGMSRPKVVASDRANRSKLNGVAGARMLVVDEPDGPESLARALTGRRPDLPPTPIGPQDPFLMMFTSGTTGMPKGVRVPFHMLRTIWAYMTYSIDLRPQDRYWNLADPGWAYGLYYGLTGPLLLGQTATMSEAPFTVARTYQVVETFGITNLAGPPTAYRQMASSPLTPPKGVRVISSAGEALDQETAAWLERSFGCPARDHFGQTELGMVLCDHHGLEHGRKAGSIGYPMPGFELATLGPDGRETAPGAPGMLAIHRASPLFWFEGYYRKDEQPFAGDYYLSGDSAVRDADGAYRFVAREDDVITSSGYRIGPFEVEAALLEHPAVAEAAVIGRPDPVRTEVVKGFVTLKDGYAPTPALAENISLFVKTRLAAHAYPKEIEFVTELPKTPSGKIQRFLLKQQEIARGAPGAAA